MNGVEVTRGDERRSRLGRMMGRVVGMLDRLISSIPSLSFRYFARIKITNVYMYVGMR